MKKIEIIFAENKGDVNDLFGAVRAHQLNVVAQDFYKKNKTKLDSNINDVLNLVGDMRQGDMIRIITSDYPDCGLIKVMNLKMVEFDKENCLFSLIKVWDE